LLEAGLTFVGYSEDMPPVGSLICNVGLHARKHNPWVNWQDSLANVPLTGFPTEYSTLSTMSMIVPNQVNDMHHGNNPEAIQTGDRWLREHLDSYIQWAQEHNSLLAETWDEDNKKENNRIVRSSSGLWSKPAATSSESPTTMSCARFHTSTAFPMPVQALTRHPSFRSGSSPLIPDRSMPIEKRTQPSGQTVR
jgi:Phosphoesterase family